MPSEIRIWSVGSNDTLQEISQTRLNFESRLEEWLDRDISILDDNLLVIGRQVETDVGGFLDLLCIDGSGDLVIVELKRDKTPRDIVAQTLEYASWVNDLSNAEISRIVDRRFPGTRSLEETFRSHFGRELPDTLNNDHRMIIVAAEIDPRCERVVKYLSERHGLNINAATFQHFGEKESGEYFARVFLLEPSQVEYHSRTSGTSKRSPNLTFEELEQIAEERCVGELYRRLIEGFESCLSKGTTRSSITFIGKFELRNLGYKRVDRLVEWQAKMELEGNAAKSRRTIISLLPGESSPETGVRFQVYMQRLKIWTGLCDDEILSSLPLNRESWSFGTALDDWSGYQGFVKTSEEADRFIDMLKRRSNS